MINSSYRNNGTYIKQNVLMYYVNFSSLILTWLNLEQVNESEIISSSSSS